MRVVYFSKTSEIGPASRYRIYQFLPYLTAQGIQCQVRPLFGRWFFEALDIKSRLLRVASKAVCATVRFLKRGWDIVTLGKTDLVVIEGQLFPYCPAWIERMLAWRGYKLAIEFDDAIYLTRFHRKKIPQLLKLSRVALVGNQSLARYARQFAFTVKVIPTVVDTDRFIPSDPRRGMNLEDVENSITVVWIGLAYNFQYLEVMREALETLQRTRSLRFRVISSRAPDLKGIKIDFVPWKLSDEVDALRGCQIGVMPLPDSEWARGKCGLKLLQYMALSLPTVSSPVGVNQEIIKPGENGLFASTPDEWMSQLTSLCHSSELRHRLGGAARKTVEERYALNVWGPRLAMEYLSLGNLAEAVNMGQPLARTLNR